jgi:hypothetical protein
MAPFGHPAQLLRTFGEMGILHGLAKVERFATFVTTVLVSGHNNKRTAGDWGYPIAKEQGVGN